MQRTYRREKSILLIILQILCILMTINILITSTMTILRPINQTKDPLIPVIVSSIWIVICIGFLLKKRWGWLMFLGAVYFILLNNISILVAIRMEITVFHFIPPIIGIVVIILMNAGQILDKYRIGLEEYSRLTPSPANFAVFCMFCGLFLLTEPFTENLLSTSNLIAKSYVILLGVIFGLSGLGLWFEKRLASKAIQPLLLFIFLSSSYILIKDWLSVRGYFKAEQIVIYIFFSLIIFLYWSVFLKSKLLKNRTQSEVMKNVYVRSP